MKGGPKLAAFDMDETLLQSAKIRQSATLDLFLKERWCTKQEFVDALKDNRNNEKFGSEHNRNETQIYTAFKDIFNLSISVEALIQKKRDHFKVYIQTITISEITGARQFLERMQQWGYILALVTNSDESSMKALMEVTGLHQYFSLMISKDHDLVDNAKPSGDIYEVVPYLLKKQEKIIFPKHNLIGFEDSTQGVQALKEAGFIGVAIYESHFKNKNYKMLYQLLAYGCHALHRNFNEITKSDLTYLHIMKQRNLIQHLDIPLFPSE